MNGAVLVHVRHAVKHQRMARTFLAFQVKRLRRFDDGKFVGRHTKNGRRSSGWVPIFDVVDPLALVAVDRELRVRAGVLVVVLDQVVDQVVKEPTVDRGLTRQQ